MPVHELHARQALLPGGWAADVRLCWDAAGQLLSVQPGSPPPEAGHPCHRVDGPLLPGLTNLHSHAFQRSFAGLTERRGPDPHDSFWSWRTRMYDFAAHLGPQEVEAIATALYVELLENGWSSVCEFHYLHHDRDGHPYADDAALSRALMRAAARAGIRLTLLPVLYQTSGFGGQAPLPPQRRFLRSTESMLRLLETLAPERAACGVRLGVAPHSLRAVPPDSLRALLAGLDTLDPTALVHLHIAEQTAEVEACLAWCGQRPLDWLLDHAPVDARWCLVHATHLTPAEITRAAATGAVAGLCPSTEANLGDGLFDLPAWQSAGGAWGLGTDSHVGVNAAEELMLLEYGQRLQRRQRNVAATPDQPDTATAMLLQAVQGGARAAGRCPPGQIAGLVVGAPADWVVLDPHHPALADLAPADQLAAHVFASHRTSALSAVWIGGRPCVQDGRHPLHDAATADFLRTRRTLLDRASRP
jgi:formimidoylglutamate deiminase